MHHILMQATQQASISNSTARQHQNEACPAADMSEHGVVSLLIHRKHLSANLINLCKLLHKE